MYRYIFQETAGRHHQPWRWEGAERSQLLGEQNIFYKAPGNRGQKTHSTIFNIALKGRVVDQD
jgi:hypothetical protein